MPENKVVPARLDIQMFVDCPNCCYLIDLLDERDTNGTMHNEESDLIRQMFPSNPTLSHSDFMCDDVVCTKCKTEFNVRELEW